MESLQEIGKTVKPFGLDGSVRVAIKDEFLEDFLSVEVVFLHLKGQVVPYFVEEIKDNDLIVLFDGINNKEDAAAISGKKLLIREEDLIPEEEKVLELEELEYAFSIGFRMDDTVIGEIGEILEIVEYPQQEMAVIDHKGKEIMVPMNENFIQEIDEDNKVILVTLPEQMIEIQL